MKQRSSLSADEIILSRIGKLDHRLGTACLVWNYKFGTVYLKTWNVCNIRAHRLRQKIAKTARTDSNNQSSMEQVFKLSYTILMSIGYVKFTHTGCSSQIFLVSQESEKSDARSKLKEEKRSRNQCDSCVWEKVTSLTEREMSCWVRQTCQTKKSFDSNDGLLRSATFVQTKNRFFLIGFIFLLPPLAK